MLFKISAISRDQWVNWIGKSNGSRKDHCWKWFTNKWQLPYGIFMIHTPVLYFSVEIWHSSNVSLWKPQILVSFVLHILYLPYVTVTGKNRYSNDYYEVSSTINETPILAWCEHLCWIYVGNIRTELFIKPTSSLSYLRRDSCPPKYVFASLAYGEFIRVRRNCSSLETYDKHSDTIFNAFLRRGYECEMLEEAKSKARSKLWSDLLSTYKTMTVQTGSNMPESLLRCQQHGGTITVFWPTTRQIKPSNTLFILK